MVLMYVCECVVLVASASQNTFANLPIRFTQSDTLFVHRIPFQVQTTSAFHAYVRRRHCNKFRGDGVV